MKKPLRKELRSLLDELSDQNFASLVFRLFTSMPRQFYTETAGTGISIPLAEHLVLSAILVVQKTKIWGTKISETLLQKMIDEVLLIGLFHDFWKYDWTTKPPEKTFKTHAYVSGDKVWEFLKEADISNGSKKRIAGGIFHHSLKSRQPISIFVKKPRAIKLFKGCDGKTYDIYRNKVRLLKSNKVVKCTPDYK